jgi:hypothetical protein
MALKRFPEQVYFTDSTNSINVGTGSVVVSGGASIANNLSVGGTGRYYGSNSNFSAIKAATSPSGNTFTLPSANPSLNGSYLVSDTSGNLSYKSAAVSTFQETTSIPVSASNITGLIFSSGNFDIILKATYVASNTANNKTQLFRIAGVLSNNSSTLWTLSVIELTGDNISLTLSITTSGQIQYLGTGVYTGFTSLTFEWYDYQQNDGTLNLTIGTNKTGNPSLGNFLTVNGSSFTDSNTAASGTLTNFYSSYIGSSTLNATNATVTTTNASTLFIQGPVIQGTNETITNNHSLRVGSGNSLFGGNVSITGSLSKGSGTFEIDHPLIENKKLIHSFIEGPRCDNLYRGTCIIENGECIVNIDIDCTQTKDCSMTEGTFEKLNTNPAFYLQNVTSFNRLKGKIYQNKLIISSESKDSDIINWMVIGERCDPFVKNWDQTNAEGNLKTER